MKVAVEISSSEIVKAVLLQTALVVDREDNPDEYVRKGRLAILELHKQFVINQHKYTDQDFLILRRMLESINCFDDIEDLPEYKDYATRRARLSYKSIINFNKDGSYTEE